jgi:hypothetical protein
MTIELLLNSPAGILGRAAFAEGAAVETTSSVAVTEFPKNAAAVVFPATALGH